MPHGALVWAAEHDKMGYAAVTPLSAPARAVLDAYLARAPRVGDTPLFPSRADRVRPMRKAEAAHLLTRAEARADLPHLDRGQFHPYRRLWASERKDLPDVDVARAGGWRDLSVMRTSYQQADAVTTLRVIEHGTRAPAEGAGEASEHGSAARGHRTDTAAA
jgi:integrase